MNERLKNRTVGTVSAKVEVPAHEPGIAVGSPAYACQLGTGVAGPVQSNVCSLFGRPVETMGFSSAIGESVLRYFPIPPRNCASPKFSSEPCVYWDP